MQRPEITFHVISYFQADMPMILWSPCDLSPCVRSPSTASKKLSILLADWLKQCGTCRFRLTRWATTSKTTATTTIWATKCWAPGISWRYNLKSLIYKLDFITWQFRRNTTFSHKPRRCHFSDRLAPTSEETLHFPWIDVLSNDWIKLKAEYKKIKKGAASYLVFE